jgi:hypothetical protein
MAQEIGSPYNQIPTHMFIPYHGGIAGWGTICGALVPAISLIGGVIGDRTESDKLINELMAWYIHHPFPEYQPHGLSLPKVAVGSTLCHVSVSKWVNAMEPAVTAGSKEKKERCAGLSGDTARKAIELLNDWTDGKFAAVHKPDPIVGKCMGCHKENLPPFTQGKENCMSCHGSGLIDIEECEQHKRLL